MSNYIVYEGVFRDGFVYRRIVSETEKMITVENCRNLNEKKIKKSANLIIGRFDSQDDAEACAKDLSHSLRKERLAFSERRKEIIQSAKAKTQSPSLQV